MITTPAIAASVAKTYYGHDLKPCQAEIMALVYDMSIPRVSVLGATQIEKSRAAARAIGLLATLGFQITIVGPKAEQAITPLQYFIAMMDHNSYFRNLMLQHGEQKVERLQAIEKKDFISFKGGGYIRALTLNERDSQEKRKSSLGKGSQIVVFEEASLTSNDTEAMVLRMIAGYGSKGRIIKLGNAITREPINDHFYRSTLGEDGYVAIRVDYHRALAEGIYAESFIAEAKRRPMFDQLYACIFPDPSGLVSGGFQRLWKLEEIINARGGSRPEPIYEENDQGEQTEIAPSQPIVGIDIGEGKPDKTSIVARWPVFAERVFETSNEDVMAQIGLYDQILKDLKPSMVNVDATGIGSGVARRLSELGHPVNAILAGSTAPEEGYANTKAYGYMKAREWMVEFDGKLGDGDWNELGEVAYKVRSDKNVIIESKQELAARGVPSYNDAEALMLTFADASEPVGEDGFEFM
jgi:hypothetical protein